MASKLTWKFSLVAGKIRVQYHPDGKLFFGSTSASGEWKAITVGGGAQDFEAHDEGLNGLSMSHDGKKIASYSQDGTVKMWSWPMNADKGEIVTRFDCPVQSADFSACDNLIAVGAQDGTVKIINVADTNQVRRIKDHEGQVKGIAFDPQRQFLATAGADGRVNIYDYLNGDVKVASMTLVPAVPVGERASFEMEWSPSGKYLAVPVLSGVAMINRGESSGEGWKSKTLEEHKHEVNAVSWSPNGRYFASAHSDMSILIWDALSQLSIDRTKCPDIPVGLKWNKSTNGLLMILANGKYAEWTGVIPRNLPDPLKAFDADSIAVQAYASQKQTLDNMFADEEAAEKAATTPAIATSSTDTSSKNSSARYATSSMVPATSSKTNIPSKSMAAGDYEVVSFGTTTKTATSDFGASTAASSKSRSTSSYDMDVTNDYEDDDSQAGAYGSAGKSWGGSGLFDLQPPFMPGATQSGATRRILAWNHIGSILARVEEFPSPQTSMEMDFNDTSLYKPYSLTQPMVIDLATMSEQGIFTSGRVVSRDHRVTTTLQFHLFNKFGMKSDWTARLEHGEAALALAAGDTWSAVATSQRRLRLFGEAGYKLAVMSLPGPVVSMVGKGSLLAVFYHCGNPFGSNGVPKSYSSAVSANGVVDEGNSQNLGWWIFNVQSRRFLSTGSPLPLSPGAQLNWIGFSTEDSLCTFDSSGTLRQLAATRQFVSGSTPLLSVEAAHAQSILLPSWSDVWFDILDTNDAESQKELDGSVVWPIAVTEEKMRYAKVSAHSDGPSSQPKPIPHSMALSMPFTSPSADPAASNENKLIRNAITLGSRLAFTIDRSSTCDGPLGDAEAENEEDDDPSFLFNFASDKDILSAQQNVDKMVLQSIREACHEGRVERAYGLAKSLFFKKSFQIAVTIASKTDQSMLAEKIAELSVRKDAERVRRQKALKRMIAPAPAPQSGSQSQSLPAAFDMSPKTRKSGAKRSLPESAAATSSSKDRAGSDDEFEVEDDDDDEDGESGLGSPASKKFTTQAIEDNDGDDHAFDRDDDADDSEDGNSMDVDPATRGTTGSVFKSSPFSIAPPFKQGGGRLVDTLSSIGKSKNASSGASSQTKASGSKKSTASPAPKKSSSRASTGKK